MLLGACCTWTSSAWSTQSPHRARSEFLSRRSDHEDLWPFQGDRWGRTIEFVRSTRPSIREPARIAYLVVARLLESLGGRYSIELGINVDAGEAEVERWFLAATLFGTRISASIAERTFVVLDRAGLVRICQARHMPWNDLVALLDEGGYVRYDFQTATRLQLLSEVIDDHYGGRTAAMGRRFHSYGDLRDALDALPGWGPVTVSLFLRELRGVWPGAQPPLDERARHAGRHLGLLDAQDGCEPMLGLTKLARGGAFDLRDLESGLVRLTLSHHSAMDGCPGGAACTVLAPNTRPREAR